MNTTPLSQHLAARVRALISSRGLKKKALAPALGITENQAYTRISGRVPFEADELEPLAEWLGVSLSDLLERSAA